MDQLNEKILRTPPIKRYTVVSVALLIAFSFPVQIAVMYKHHLFLEWPSVLSKLTSVNIMCMLALGVYAYLAFVSKLKNWQTLSLLALLLFNNWIVSLVTNAFSPWQTYSASLSLVIIFALYMHTPLYKILSNTKLQWWRSMPRKLLQKNVRLAVHQLQKSCWKSVDISQTGIFLKNIGEEQLMTHPKLKIGSQFPIYIDQLNSPLEVEVVRHQKNNQGKYPSGLGLKFVDLGNHQKTILTKFINNSSSTDQLTF